MLLQNAKPEWEVRAKTRLNILEAKAAAAGMVWKNIQEQVIFPLQERRKNLMHNIHSVMNKTGMAEEISAIDGEIAEAEKQSAVANIQASKLQAQTTKARRAFEQVTVSEPTRMAIGG